MIKMVVFDMAGTTVNEDNVVYKTLQKAINQHGNDFSLDEVLAEGAGKEKLKAIKDILSSKDIELPENEIQEIFQNFLNLLKEAYQNLSVKPIEGAEEVFSFLRKNKILVVLNTGYNQEIAESLVNKLNWELGKHFDDLVTASQVEKSRPYPDMILLAKEKFEITDAGKIAKVGDSIIDIVEGKNAGCGLSIGITTGAHTEQQLLTAGPDYIINDLRELEELTMK
ncbi:MAG: phosphonatase-like hydrolase [Flammeovirgaceae bacterium]|nr:phosphonatase-like hydrolase [Flammeovirgaceae bacterium]